ncbi:MAG: hypothetical protein J1F16_09550, partial [Muribaculaceae bacterium]|nr:hypothetical protein [Muribaculaceae bacterium]
IVKKRLIDEFSDNRKLKIIKEYYLRDLETDHTLKIEIDERQRIHIYGSLRKLLYGEGSIRDLNHQDFLKSVEKLAKAFNLPFLSLLNYKGLTGVEIGYNIITQQSCNLIIPKICKYGKVKHNDNFRDKNETLYKKGSDKNFKIYDKAKELWDTVGIKIKGNLTRVEVEMKDSDSFKRYRLGKLKSLADISQEWINLQLFFLSEIARLRFINPVNMEKLRSIRQREMGKYLKKFGFIRGRKKFERYFSLKEGSAENYFIGIMAKYPLFGTYCHSSFKRDVAKCFLKINRSDKNIPRNVIAHILWGTKQGSKMRRSLYNKGGIIA